MLTAANVTHMMTCTNARLDQLMGAARRSRDRIFHYLPFCFAGSWILLLTALSRNSVLTLSMDFTKLADELKLASPDYFLNVPTLLERMRTRDQETSGQRGGFATTMFSKRAKGVLATSMRKRAAFAGLMWLALAKTIIFPAIRKKVGAEFEGADLRVGAAGVETQLFFMMLGIPVLQVYGLTETTAICTMDDPQHRSRGAWAPRFLGLK